MEFWEFQYYHEKVNHAGREQTLAESREGFWIVKGRGLLKKVIKDCLYCKRLRTKPTPPLMGDLPHDRIEIGQTPFYNTGIDYFGPILTKQSRRTRSTMGKTKRWGALFTCLYTRAVHLEIVWDLTTNSFILTLQLLTTRKLMWRYDVNGKQSRQQPTFFGRNRLKNISQC